MIGFSVIVFSTSIFLTTIINGVMAFQEYENYKNRNTILLKDD